LSVSSDGSLSDVLPVESCARRVPHRGKCHGSF
jgi:hypothetical protein